jgi:hypothetical protein
MTERNKFRFLLFMTTALIALVLLFNVLQEYVMPEIQGYIERKIYYERVISKKGLGLHKGMYWREKKQ